MAAVFAGVVSVVADIAVGVRLTLLHFSLVPDRAAVVIDDVCWLLLSLMLTKPLLSCSLASEWCCYLLLFRWCRICDMSCLLLVFGAWCCSFFAGACTAPTPRYLGNARATILSRPGKCEARVYIVGRAKCEALL
eukprot:6426829-Pyramimonas_sp.AAC.1